MLTVAILGRCDGNCAITCGPGGKHKYGSLKYGMTYARISATVEESIRCWPGDPFHNDSNTFVHEFAHLVHMAGFSNDEKDQVSFSHDTLKNQ